LPSSVELLTVALAAVFLVDVVAVTEAGITTVAAALAADGGLPTGRPDDDGLVGCLAAAGCLAARAFSTAGAGSLSAAGFAAGVLVRSFFGDTGTAASTLFTGSAACCTDNARYYYGSLGPKGQITCQ